MGANPTVVSQDAEEPGHLIEPFDVGDVTHAALHEGPHVVTRVRSGLHVRPIRMMCLEPASFIWSTAQRRSSRALPRWVLKCTHVAISGTRAAETGLSSAFSQAKIWAKMRFIARHRPREPTTPG